MSELNEKTLSKAIHRMRSLGTDTQRWEIKESAQELPKKTAGDDFCLFQHAWRHHHLGLVGKTWLSAG